MLKNVNFKAVYRSDTDNILEDFYIPALQNSISYKRAVGFFSASMLAYAAQGLSAFVKNEGRMKLIFGGEISTTDYDAIKEGYSNRLISEKIGAAILRQIDEIEDNLFQCRLELLSWLIASGQLDIKIALKRHGMYHEKVGIFEDANGDRIIFQGSANESKSALLPDFNFESINVFQSWRLEFSEHFTPYLDGFEALWNPLSNPSGVIVIDFPEAANRKLVKVAEQAKLPTTNMELSLWQEMQRSLEHKTGTVTPPKIPETYNGQQFSLREHQGKVLRHWKSLELKGIMKLATGAGKTITAIYAAIKLYEKLNRLFVVISVPFVNLADQWVDELHAFNIFPIKAYDSKDSWHTTLSESVSLYQLGSISFVCVVVVNRTFLSDAFQTIMKQIPSDQFMFIGDECHRHGSENIAQRLPENARIRLGLSATPESYFDSSAEERLCRYYGDILPGYDLADALRDKVLTPYYYYIVLVELTEEEEERYGNISAEISRLAAMSAGRGEKQFESVSLQLKIFERARLVAKAENKLHELSKLLTGKSPSPHTLVYCGDGGTEDDSTGDYTRQVDAVSNIFHKHGWKNSHFTSYETRAQRKEILERFRLSYVDAMVAIRCLDEGIDIPACKTAYILASSKNPRQFIQRRGRILRRSPGKKYAQIYDMVVIPRHDATGDQGITRSLVADELERVVEFASLALNSADSLGTIYPVLKKFGLEHLF